MPGRLEGKTALITAAGQGIGKASALAYANEGANVIAADINSESLESLASESGIKTRVLDVTKSDAIESLAKELGAVDVLFNCAGLSIMELCWNAERTTGIFPWISMRVRCSA